MIRILLTSLLILSLASCVRAQNTLYERTLNSLDAYQEFLALPNDARKPEQLEPNLQWLEREFAKRGFVGQRLENAGIDLLLFTYQAPGPDAETVLFYGHVDGQPVDPTKWVLSPPLSARLRQDDDPGRRNGQLR